MVTDLRQRPLTSDLRWCNAVP